MLACARSLTAWCTVQETQPTLTSGIAPPLIYDYYGFPEAAYSIQYPAPGSLQVAERAAGLLRCPLLCLL